MEKLKSYHFIGIGGIGMSAVARVLLEKNLKVTGSDLSLSATIEELKEMGALIHIGQSKEQITENATVIYSTDIKKTNPEFERALELKCPILHRSEILSELTRDTKALCVAGTHGKTTTTSLLLTVLMHAGKDPSFAVGGIVPGLSNGKAGKGEFFVLEADESDGSFINYNPFGAIVTNIEAEHMNHYGTLESLKSAFKTFIDKVHSKDHLFYCADDPTLAQLNEGVSYGFSPLAKLKITHFSQKGWNIFFDIAFEGKTYKAIEVPLTGIHNALNAAAVFGLCLRLKLTEDEIRQGLKAFKGVKRRLEKKGEFRNLLLVDDYAHHPTEIEVTLKALREAVEARKMIAVVQPHRYSRLAAHMDEFAKAFDFADEVIVTDIFTAREEPIDGITSEALIEKIKMASTVPVRFVSRNALVEDLKASLRPHDVLITLGAGDITYLHGDLIREFEKTPPKKYSLGLIFGGRSCEHEISLRSCRYVAESLNPEIYDIKYFGIDKEGNWICGQKAKELLHEATSIGKEAGGKNLLHPEISKELIDCDLFFPVLHGSFGEDGTIQGFFEMLCKPYAGPDFRSAAITMDKVMTKKLLIANGVPTPPYLSFSHWEWRKNPEEWISQIQSQLTFPVYVKPARAGSSVGVSRVNAFEELNHALNFAFRYDSYAIVEEGQIEARELEFAVLGNALEGRVAVPHPGEKCAGGQFVDYNLKYSTSPVKTDLNPHLDEEVLKRGKELAKKAYEAVGITGMSRVDCLLKKDGSYNFFEINAIPGLTKLSLFPKIWNREGVPGDKLVDHLVIEALHRSNVQNRHVKTL